MPFKGAEYEPLIEFVRVGTPDLAGLLVNAAEERCTDNSVGARLGDRLFPFVMDIRFRRSATSGVIFALFAWDIRTAALGCFLAPKPIIPEASSFALPSQAPVLYIINCSIRCEE